MGIFRFLLPVFLLVGFSFITGIDFKWWQTLPIFLVWGFFVDPFIDDKLGGS